MPGQEPSKLASKLDENLSKTLADERAIQRTVESLAARNMEAIVVESRDTARSALIEHVAPGSEVYYSTSETLATQNLSGKIPTIKTFMARHTPNRTQQNRWK